MAPRTVDKREATVKGRRRQRARFEMRRRGVKKKVVPTQEPEGVGWVIYNSTAATKLWSTRSKSDCVAFAAYLPPLICSCPGGGAETLSAVPG